MIYKVECNDCGKQFPCTHNVRFCIACADARGTDRFGGSK